MLGPGQDRTVIRIVVRVVLPIQSGGDETGDLQYASTQASRTRRTECIKLTCTWQLISPAAYTLAFALQMIVLFCPVSTPVRDPAEPVMLAKPDWHALAVWQTLHPVPVQPSSHEQEVKFANGDPLASGRPEPWKMLPPHAGCEHVDPPKPGGHAHDVPLGVP